jgi:hypothetical protein
LGKGFENCSRLYQQRAKQALPLLVARAKAGRDMTYKELARQMGVHHRTLAYALGAVGDELERLSHKWHEKIPPINCLVVSKSKRTPGKGINFAMPYRKFQSLTPLAKRQVMRGLYADIWGYPKWDKILKQLGIAPVVPADSLERIARKAKYRHHGGGESEGHRILKAYLFSHPQVLGIAKNAQNTEEYPFISADRIDLLFKLQLTWIGVEVKDNNVDAAELMRGIFQVVKYQALIEAQQRYEQKTVDGRVILAIGGKLSHELASLADLLDVNVIESIFVPPSFAKIAKEANTGAHE